MSVKPLSRLLDTYVYAERTPTTWCPGCGIGIVLQSMIRAIDDLGLDTNRIAVVSGVGCAAHATSYLKFDAFHGLHGRVPAHATGIKLAKPELTVLCLLGDGDGLAIGGNQFIHAARRNIDLTAILFNNFTYGRTGGQFSPTTPHGAWAQTAPFGMMERNFDVCELSRAAGATYVARSIAYNGNLTTRLIRNAIKHKGFSVVEVLLQCTEIYGRYNKQGDGAAMLTWQREHAVTPGKAAGLSPEQLEGRFVIGELHRSEAPEFCEEYDRLIARVQGKAR
ncbi:MAG: 2-oxoglutarate ferredoxin oxidoreductase subunit beta [Candidatus Rokubacteria bacterium]|nr:2-oxoglutarate ferredoxin oxidoreductase subunit beta [Candidatus Rokubacteria bacterium]